MIKVAITGNIAAGKSVAENYIKEKGYPVFDTDKLCHDILSTCKEDIKKLFSGYDIVENEVISRKKLGNWVFTNPELKKKLEDFIYPHLKEKIIKIMSDYRKENLVFVSIPLLYEVGWEDLFDKIIFVKADDDVRLTRLMKRNGYTKNEALQRIRAQKPQDEKIKKSDFIICNNDDIMSLQKQADEIIILLKAME